MVRFLPGDPPPQVAFAVTRKVGSAVARNRVRRQLRSAARQLTAERVLPGGVLLISVQPGAGEQTFGALVEDLRRALVQAVTGDRSRDASA
jgi:ribonuclease P protein component